MLTDAALTGYDCKIDQTSEDVLNLHSTSTGQPTWISGQAQGVWVRPIVNFVGLANSGTSNNQTEHEDARGMAIMPTYRGGNGRPFASIDNARATIFGGSIGPSTRTQTQGYYETLSAGWTSGLGATSGCQLTLVETTIATSQGPVDIAADTGGVASVKCFGMTHGALRVSGAVTFAAMP